MNSSTIKWLSSLFAAIIIGIIEFVRHQFLHVISMDWGNLIVAGATGVLVFLYFHGVFAVLENLHQKLQQEKEETAVLAERYRIARELHDSVAQTLFFLNVKVKEIERLVKEKGVHLAAVDEMQEAIRMTDKDLRKYIFILQKVPEEKVLLVEAIHSYIAKYEEQNNISVELTIIGDLENTLNQTVKNRLFRIFQELLCNVQKHAGAKQVFVQLELTDFEFFMAICDNGKGFVTEKLSANKLSFGLRNVEEDVRFIGAQLDFSSTPGKGTTVIVRLPLQQEVKSS